MNSGTSSELSSMESVSQLVLTIERLEGNPHLVPVVNGNGRLIKCQYKVKIKVMSGKSVSS